MARMAELLQEQERPPRKFDPSGFQLPNADPRAFLCEAEHNPEIRWRLLQLLAESGDLGWGHLEASRHAVSALLARSEASCSLCSMRSLKPTCNA